MQPSQKPMNELPSLTESDGSISVDTALGLAAQMGLRLKAKKAALDANTKSALGSQSLSNDGKTPEADSGNPSGTPRVG